MFTLQQIYAMSKFAQFNLDETILGALTKMGFEEPSPIQTETIPAILAREDLIALAQTGSGKTAACAIPLCQLVDTKSNQIQALVIVPTRELALQYATEAQKIGARKGVKAFAIFGGESAGMQQSKLKNGVQTLVLDEADEMLSMGFYEDLKFVMQCLVHKHQTLLFSATMPKEINILAKNFMNNPKEVVLTSTQRTPTSINHNFLYCHQAERTTALVKLMKDCNPNQSIVFCHSRIEVEKVCRELQKHVDGVDFLHAGLSQEARTIVTNRFRTGRTKHLVATDVVSRGLDFSGITHVFIYHLGDDPDIYVHRSGRTGRNDRTGMVVTLVTDRELYTLKRVLETIKQEASWIGEPPSERRYIKPPSQGFKRSYRKKPSA